MTTVITRGAGSAQALGYAARATAANYIEDVFSTYLYTGNGSTQTVTNGIDLSTKGGLVWSKCRSSDLGGNGIHTLIDTVRGVGNRISSELTGGQVFNNNTITAFNSNGFSIGNSPINNTNAATFVSWTFREQAKFFDVVTYTGTGANRTISHNLGSVPGCIIVKSTSAVNDWRVYHRSLATADSALRLNSTAAAGSSSTFWNSTAPTSTQFTVGSDGSVNASGGTYVAYLFAHDAGGFGLSGADNVISCGSYVGNYSTGGNQNINLGFEPQWVMIKNASDSSADPIKCGWQMYDVMRGLNVSGTGSLLLANSSNAQSDAGTISINSQGFNVASPNTNDQADTYIYIAIRRGPMRTPTSGTSVFSPNISSGGSTTEITTGFPNDLTIYNRRGGAGANSPFVDRLRGLAPNSSSTSQALISSSTDAEGGYNVGYEFWNTSFKIGSYYGGNSNVFYSLRRAPGFFDVVCYTGTGVARTVTHNLAAVPELIIVKKRNASGTEWATYSAATGASKFLNLNSTIAATTPSPSTGYWNSTSPTSTVFSLGNWNDVNQNGATFVAYLFATVADVSKVGSYTGTGTTKQIDCGFTGGARFVLIKRTDSTGDWYVWDRARGIVAGNDPYLLLNSTAAEVTNTDYIDTYSAGFEISSTAPAAINANGGTFIFLAIA